MTLELSSSREFSNPLDRVERIAEQRDWRVDRTNDYEVLMLIGGGWTDLSVSLSWRDDLEALQFVCTPDLRVPEKRRDEVGKLLVLINAQMVYGHFDLWSDGTILYRYSLLLTGGANANDAQCEDMIRLGVDATHTYFPAMNFVIWAGQKAETALANAMLETVGEA